MRTTAAAAHGRVSLRLALKGFENFFRVEWPRKMVSRLVFFVVVRFGYSGCVARKRRAKPPMPNFAVAAVASAEGENE